MAVELSIAIIASGKAYQEAAGWAAATYMANAVCPGGVTVLVPKGEHVTQHLREWSKKAGFRISRFPVRLISNQKFTSQLKCQAYVYAISCVCKNGIILIVDADTCCM